MDKHLIKEDNKIQFIENIGNKLDDFEILQTLGKGGYGFVAKVKSKINQKLYAMKMIDFSLIKLQTEKDLSLNEIKIIQSLNSPHVIKYYNSFWDGNCLYVLMEFINNGDIKGYINAHQNMNKPIPEDELWELFYQCIAGLHYIHNKNLIHRDIKPANLFMTEDKTIKIGDFGVSATRKKTMNINTLNSIYTNSTNSLTLSGQIKNARETLMVGTPIFMSPEMFSHEGYGSKIDIYAMGITFFDMCFYEHPRKLVEQKDQQGKTISMSLEDVPPKYNLNIYSEEIKKLIYKMIERDQKLRYTATEAFNHIKKIYNKKFKQNSSIDCIYRCLYSFQNLTNYMIKNSKFINSTLQERPISNSFLYAINNMNNKDWVSYLITLREILTFENSCFIDPGEIDPIDLLKFILERFHKESCLGNIFVPYIFTPNNISIVSNEQQSLNNYLLNFQNSKSCVNDFFFGTIETIKLCISCKNKNFYFNNFIYLTFDIDEALKNGLSFNNNNLLNYFIKQNSMCINNSSFCFICKTMTYHQESKLFFTLPYNLVICFKGEKNYYDNQYLSYPLDLDFSSLKLKSAPGKYSLKGVIKCSVFNGKKFYMCLYPDLKQNKWIMSDGYSLQFIDSPLMHKIGDVVMLFYSSIN